MRLKFFKLKNRLHQQLCNPFVIITGIFVWHCWWYCRYQ